MPQRVCTCRMHALHCACSRVQRSTHTLACKGLTHMHTFVGSTHAHVQGFNTPVGLLPFELSNLSFQYSTLLMAFNGTLHTRLPPRHPAHTLDTLLTPSTPCSHPRHPAHALDTPMCDICPYITCVWWHTLWSMLKRFRIQR